MVVLSQTFSSVYGPVQSWRYGRSLGIDPIGQTSTCSYDCAYCQLGTIHRKTHDRQIFISTAEILEDLSLFAPWDVDVITLSGSGEPTLALNLGEILLSIKAFTGKSTAVLTNGSLLHDGDVRRELGIADRVAVKLDAIATHQLHRINHPVESISLLNNWAGLRQFRQSYRGHLAIQTMVLSPWKDREQSAYITLMQTLAPDEIQLNTPTRPRPGDYVPEARGNSLKDASARSLRPVSGNVLAEFGDRIQKVTNIPVRFPAVLPA